MTWTTSGKVASHPTMVSPFGADLGVKPWEQVVLDRIDGAPLSFVGCQISQHWRHLYGDRVLRITLWRRKTIGFAVAFPVWFDGGLRNDSVSVDSLSEAITFLEDFCALPPHLSAFAGPIGDYLLQFQMAACFSQAFSFLVGEALAAWTDLDHIHGHSPLQHRVTA